MDRIEIAMEGLVRSQTQLLRAQVILTDQIDSLRQGHKDLALAQQKTEAALHHFIEENEKAHQRLDEKMAETTEKLNALTHVVDNLIRGKL